MQIPHPDADEPLPSGNDANNDSLMNAIKSHCDAARRQTPFLLIGYGHITLMLV